MEGRQVFGETYGWEIHYLVSSFRVCT